MIIEYQQIQLGLATSADSRFIRDLYCTSRDPEMAYVDWPEKQKKVFLRQQYALQTKHFDKVYPKARKQLIFYKGKPIGRFFTDENQQDNHWHLLDITLLREYRGLGIGRYLLQSWLKQAHEVSSRATLYVANHNRAFNLYASLGFKKIGVKDRYYYLEVKSN